MRVIFNIVRLILLFSIVLCVSFSWGQTTFPGDSTRPHRARTGANLVNNPTFQGSTGWQLLGNTAIGTTVTHSTDGSGSVKLITAYPDANYSQVNSTVIPIVSGKTYTFSAYFKSSQFPAQMSLMVAFADT